MTYLMKHEHRIKRDIVRVKKVKPSFEEGKVIINKRQLHKQERRETKALLREATR